MKDKRKMLFVSIGIHLIYIGREVLPHKESLKPSKLSLKSKSDPADFG
jgi:hypothetical protein